jgi:hypothetical protein
MERANLCSLFSHICCFLDGHYTKERPDFLLNNQLIGSPKTYGDFACSLGA